MLSPFVSRRASRVVTRRLRYDNELPRTGLIEFRTSRTCRFRGDRKHRKGLNAHWAPRGLAATTKPRPRNFLGACFGFRSNVVRKGAAAEAAAAVSGFGKLPEHRPGCCLILFWIRDSPPRFTACFPQL